MKLDVTQTLVSRRRHSASLCFPLRDEALAVRALLSVRPGRRHRGLQDDEDEGPGLRRLQGARRVHQRPAAAPRLPLLQQAHGRNLPDWL